MRWQLEIGRISIRRAATLVAEEVRNNPALDIQFS